MNNMERIFRVRIPLIRILVGESLALMVLAAANAAVFVHFYRNGKTAPILPRAFGHVICLNFGLLLLLPQRNSIWTPLLGIAMERMVKYHRIMGRMVFASVTAHLISWYVCWIPTRSFFHGDSQNGYTYPLMRTAILGQVVWILLCIILLLSIECFRRKNFELFFYSHHLFVPVIGLSISHSKMAQPWKSDLLLYWLTPGVLLYFGDLVMRAWRTRFPTELISIEQDEGGNVFHIRLRRKNLHFEPGQYVYLNFPKVSLLQWHPFSITASPSEVRMTPGGSIFAVAMRDMGPGSWSRQVVSLAESSPFHRNIKVRMDGPYGKLGIDIFDYPILVMIAGGIGVTPLFSVLSELHNNSPDLLEKMYFVWCAKHHNYMNLFLEYMADMERNDFYSKIEFLRYVTHKDATAPPKKRHVMDDGVHIMTSSSSSSAVGFMGGRPNFDDFFMKLITEHGHHRIGVLVSGPPQMITDVRTACYKYNKLHKPTIDVHSDGFFL